MEGIIIPVLHKDIVDEYKAVLSRARFGLTESIITDIINSMENVGFYIDAETLDIELPDPKDHVFYEVVMEERKEEDAYLITENIKHFPKEPVIVTPRQMLDMILGNVRFFDQE